VQEPAEVESDRLAEVGFLTMERPWWSTDPDRRAVVVCMVDLCEEWRRLWSLTCRPS